MRIFEENKKHLDAEIQQRATEYLSLASNIKEDTVVCFMGLMRVIAHRFLPCAPLINREHIFTNLNVLILPPARMGQSGVRREGGGEVGAAMSTL